MIYLASPYSDPSPVVRENRYDLALDATAYLMRQGIVVFSPIVHCYEIQQRYKLPGDHNFWLTYDEGILRRCFAMWILCIEGWRESKGIASEMKFCERNNIRVSYLHVEGEDYIAYAEPPVG